MLGRPYSFVNPPGGPAHEFYFNVLPQGPLSPRLAELDPDDSLWLLDRANGFFCIAELPDASALWCIATGTGLGLWVSQGIVQNHGGSIRIRSRSEGPHRGTLFSIFIPGMYAATHVA